MPHFSTDNTSQSPIIFISSTPKTPIASNNPKVNFYLPYPSSSSSSSCDSLPETPIISNTTRVNFYLPPPYSSSSSSCSSALTPSSNSPQTNFFTTPICYGDSNNPTYISQYSDVIKPKVPSHFKIMSQDDSSYSSDSFSNPSNEAENENNEAENENGSVTTTTESILPETISITDMAAALINEQNDVFNLSKEEEDLIKDSTVNTKKYEQGKKGIEDRFFETIEKYGGTQLQQLLTTITTNKGTERDRAFYFVLRGRKTEQKRIILSKCLLLCALKWRNQTKKDFGNPLQPRTMAQLMKVLFTTFKAKHIKFNHKYDFNGPGEFHAVLKKQWEEERKKDPKFATGVLTSTFDYEADSKIRNAYPKTFDPFSTSDGTKGYLDRMRYLVFVLGRYFFVRGRKEVAFMKWSQLKFGETHEAGNILKYIELRNDWDKSHQLKLTNPTARGEHGIHPRIYPNENDPLCPYKFLEFYRTLCVPTQERLFCAQASQKQMKAFAANNLPYLYNENQPVGENKIDGCTKEFAKAMGFENWERCTNHGNRKLGITTAMTNADKGIAPIVLGAARHKNYNTSLGYQLPNKDMYHTYNNALVGKHVKSPPKSPKDHKVQRTHKDEKPPALVITKAKQEGEEDCNNETSIPNLRETDSINTELTGGPLTTYQAFDKPPLVTPANYQHPKTIVQQNHLNHIQRNIFVQPPSDYSYYVPSNHQLKEREQYIPPLHQSCPPMFDNTLAIAKNNEEEKKELINSVKSLNEYVAQVKEKHQEVVNMYKEKIDDLKHELREAKQNAKLADLQKHQCVIQ
jgi:hypothetical protein